MNSSLASYYISVIQEKRSLIVQDLLCDVVFNLREHNVINNEEFLDIMGGENYVKAEMMYVVANRLLDRMVEKRPEDVVTFVKLLQKDYSWLYEMFDDGLVREYLLLGNVPVLPGMLARRTKLLNKVEDSLLRLKRNNFVVLLGMPGCGKTTLAAHCLHSASLLQHFNKTVYWVSTNYEDISLIQKNLNILLRDKSVKLTGDTEVDRLSLVEALSGSDCLLVLDDVQSSSVVDAVKVGCKILITARDKTVMKKFEAVTEFIEVDSSLTQDETLSLFSQALDCEGKRLPFEASTIHTLARGFPLTVSLLVGILADNKESALQPKSSIWKNLINLLDKKQYGHRQPNPVIGKAVQNLGKDFKTLFDYFALFVEDINIKQEVFCTLWDMKELDVQEILLHFVNKSLIVRKWVKDGYVYGVHDIILSYLKGQMSHDNTVALHRKLIERYEEKCTDKDLSKLPSNDNYIFYYIGYHLKAAQLTERLVALYTNLDFIEAKLRITGPADLLIDYKKYLQNLSDIPNHMEVNNKIQEICKFVERCGQDINLQEVSDVDIVQFVLQECHSSSSLYKDAIKLAKVRCNTPLYAQYPMGPFEKGNEPSKILHHPSTVTALKTTIFPDIVIIGYEKGYIVLYNTRSQCVMKRYAGHEGGPVRGLALNRDNSYFLSFSLDKKISIWQLDFTNRDMFNFDSPMSDISGGEPRTPSPETVQENHSPLWTSKATVSYNHLPHSANLVSAVYGECYPNLIASTTPLFLMVWKDYRLSWQKDIGSSVNSCLFCQNDSIVLAGSSKIHGYSVHNGDLLFETPLPINLSIQSSVISLLMNPVHCLERRSDVLVTTQDVMGVWSFDVREKCKVFHPVNQYRQYQLADIGRYIAVAYGNSEIELFDKDTASSLGLFHNRTGRMLCLALSDDKLYAAYNDKTVCVWQLSKVSGDLTPSLPKPPLAIAWIEGIPHIASFSKNNSILVKMERKELIEIENAGKADLLALSDDGQMVAWCCNSSRDASGYLARSSLSGKVDKFHARPNLLKVSRHKDHGNMVLAAEGSQLLVWSENKMTFRGQNSSANMIVDVFHVDDSIICVLANASLEEYHVKDASYSRWIHREVEGSRLVQCGGSSKGRIAVVMMTSSGDRMLSVYSPFELLFREVLQANCSCVTFSPDGRYLALFFPDKSFIWMWKELKGDSKVEIRCPVQDGLSTMAVSCDGSVCIRTEKSVQLLGSAHDSTWCRSSLRGPATINPVLHPSPTTPGLFATVDYHHILHTVTLFKPPPITE